MRLNDAIIKPEIRENKKDTPSARWINIETNNPFNPSDIIIPNIKTTPNNTENRHPAKALAESENKTTWLTVSKDKAKSTPINIIKIGLKFLGINFLDK